MKVFLYMHLIVGGYTHMFDCFCSADLCEKEPFLSTEEGEAFRSVFKYVRLQYIINDLASARILERDNILQPGKMSDLISS